MIEDEVLRFCITAALSAATAYCAFRAGSKSPMVVGGNEFISASAMAVMFASLAA